MKSASSLRKISNQAKQQIQEKQAEENDQKEKQWESMQRRWFKENLPIFEEGIVAKAEQGGNYFDIRLIYYGKEDLYIRLLKDHFESKGFSLTIVGIDGCLKDEIPDETVLRVMW